MNKDTIKNTPLKSFLKGVDGRIKDFLLLSSLAIVLIFAAWQIFHTEEQEEAVAVSATEAETKVMRLLEEIDGVGEANVIVYEAEEGAKSVVVVCEGANNLRVVMNVREAVAAALGTEEKAVKIYLKKE